MTDLRRRAARSPAASPRLIVAITPARRRPRCAPVGEHRLRRASAVTARAARRVRGNADAPSPRPLADAEGRPRPPTSPSETVAERPHRTGRAGRAPRRRHARAGPRADRAHLASRPRPVAATTPFLDLRDRVVPLMPDYDERGLLGLAFHPDFATNGRLFVYYGAPVRTRRSPASRTTPTRSVRVPRRTRPTPSQRRPGVRAGDPPVRASPSSTTAAAGSGSGRTGCSTSARVTAAVRATRARATRRRATPRT